MPKERKLPLYGLLPLLTMPATGVRQVRTITFCFLYSTIIPNPPLPVKGEIAFLSPYFFRAPESAFFSSAAPLQGAGIRAAGRPPPQAAGGGRNSHPVPTAPLQGKAAQKSADFLTYAAAKLTIPRKMQLRGRKNEQKTAQNGHDWNGRVWLLVDVLLFCIAFTGRFVYNIYILSLIHISEPTRPY